MSDDDRIPTRVLDVHDDDRALLDEDAFSVAVAGRLDDDEPVSLSVSRFNNYI